MPTRAAGDGEDRALGDELPREIGRPRAECEADPQLPATRKTGRKQQIRDVGAADEQYGKDGPEQHPQLRPDGADDGLAVGADVDAVVVTELLRERLAERAHLGAGAVERDARLQAGDHLQKVAAARRGIQLAREWHEYLRTAVAEMFGHHANDFVRFTVERECLSR